MIRSYCTKIYNWIQADHSFQLLRLIVCCGFMITDLYVGLWIISFYDYAMKQWCCKLKVQCGNGFEISLFQQMCMMTSKFQKLVQYLTVMTWNICKKLWFCDNELFTLKCLISTKDRKLQYFRIRSLAGNALFPDGIRRGGTFLNPLSAIILRPTGKGGKLMCLQKIIEVKFDKLLGTENVT